MSYTPQYKMTVYTSKEVGTTTESTITQFNPTNFSTWDLKNVTVSDDAALGPDSVQTNASTFRETTTNGPHFVSASFTAGANSDVTVMLWVTGSNRSYGRLYLDNVGVGSYGVDFSLTGSGSVTPFSATSGSVLSSHIGIIPNGWAFIDMVVNVASVPTSLNVVVAAKTTSASSNQSYAGSTSNGFNLHGVWVGNAIPLAPSTTGPSGSAHTDDFRVATTQGITDFQPYMAIPSALGSRVSLPTGGSSIGELTVTLYDPIASGSGNAARWVTAFMGDDSGRNRLLGRKASVQESTDGGATWQPYFNGRVHDVSLSSALQYTLRIRDSIQSLKANVFTQKPSSSDIDYLLNETILPVGFDRAVGGLPTVTDPLHCTVTNLNPVYGAIGFGGQYAALLNVDGSHKVRDDNYTSEALRNAVNTTTDLYGIFSSRRTNCVATLTNLTAGNSGQYQVVSFTTLMDNNIERVDTITVSPAPYTGTDPFLTGWQVADNIQLTCLNAGSISDTNAMWLYDVHPVTVWKDLLDGKFNQSGSALKVPYDVSAFASLEADGSIPHANFRITKSDDMVDFIEKYICLPYGLAYGIHFEGTDAVIHPFRITYPEAALLPTTTITSDDLVATSGVTWSAGTPLSGIRYKAYEDQLLGVIVNDPSSSMAIGNAIRAGGDNQLVRPYELPYIHLNPADYEFGGSYLEIDAIGMRYFLTDDASYTNSRSGITAKAESQMTKYVSRFMNGCPSLTVTCVKNNKVNGLKVGDWVLVDLEKMPNTTIKQRGGTRLMQVAGIDSSMATRQLTLLDGALNSTMSSPSINSVASHPSGSGDAINVNITTTENADTELQFAPVTTGNPVPAAVSSEWLSAGTYNIDTTTVDIGIQVPMGKTTWVRARNHSPYTSDVKLPSPWVYAGSGVNLSAIAAPSSLSISAITPGSAHASWATGSNSANLELYLSSPSGSSLARIATLPAQSTSYDLYGLENYPSSSFTFGVRHVEGYNASSTTTADFSTSGSLNTLPSMSYMLVFIG